MRFGERLKELRMSQHMTQQELANRLGVAKSIVSYYESGERFPSYDILVRIARIFRVTTDYLLEIDHRRMLDVSDLSPQGIEAVSTVAEALKRQDKG
ncbi:MAG: helix-turn-helix domain-containing protein [Acutalibacteraceae bacterium]